MRSTCGSKGMVKKKITPELLDSVFEGVELPTNQELRDQTARHNRTEGVKQYYQNESLEHKKIRGLKVSKTKREGHHPTRGIPNTPTQKARISKALKGKKKPERSAQHRQTYMKPCMTPDGPFESTKAATAHWGYSWAENVAHKIKRGHKGWYWITREEYERLKG